MKYRLLSVVFFRQTIVVACCNQTIELFFLLACMLKQPVFSHVQL